MMMTFLLHFASILPMLMKSNGQLSRIDGCRQFSFCNFMVALDLLMGPSSKSLSLGIILHIKVSLMGKKICTTLTWWWWTTMGYSYVLTLGT
jgi:hypothetical protein